MLNFKTAHILDVGKTQEQEDLFHEIENILYEYTVHQLAGRTSQPLHKTLLKPSCSRYQ